MVVIPAWNKTETLLHNLFSFYGSKDKKEKLKLALTKQIYNLNKLFTQKSIVDFIYDHLRFPNMKVNVIDYSNATNEQKKQIDEYRKKLGIPDDEEKKKILKQLNRLDEIKESDKIMAEMKELRKMINKAKFEARFTGARRGFLDMLENKMFSLQKAYVNARTLEEQQWKSNIVKKPGNIAKVIEPPPKTPEQL